MGVTLSTPFLRRWLPPLACDCHSDQKCDLPVRPQPMLLFARSEVCRAAMAFDAAAARVLRTVVCIVYLSCLFEKNQYTTPKCALCLRSATTCGAHNPQSTWFSGTKSSTLCCRADCCTTTVMLPTSAPRFLVVFQPNASWDAKEQCTAVTTPKNLRPGRELLGRGTGGAWGALRLKLSGSRHSGHCNVRQDSETRDRAKPNCDLLFGI